MTHKLTFNIIWKESLQLTYMTAAQQSAATQQLDAVQQLAAAQQLRLALTSNDQVCPCLTNVHLRC